MPSFPTFQIPQHPANTGGEGGHDVFLQSMSRDMSDGGSSTTPMEMNNANATSSQGFNMISSEVSQVHICVTLAILGLSQYASSGFESSKVSCT